MEKEKERKGRGKEEKRKGVKAEEGKKREKKEERKKERIYLWSGLRLLFEQMGIAKVSLGVSLI